MRAVLSEANESSSGAFAMPAPVGGWNARDALARMRSTDAIYLDNWFPSPTAVDVRPGYAVSARLPEDSEIMSLLNCAKPDGTAKRFAVTSDGVYDVTAGGDITSIAYAVSHAKVEHININVAGTTWMWCCNGVNNSFAYNSSTDVFTALTTISTPSLTGITSADVTNVSMWKGRVILCEKDSLSFWYLGLNSVGGAATEFDLGQIFKRGGYLMATANWSVDAGDGPDDRFVAITSEGEVAIYQGTDPSNISTFALVGIYFIGRPIGRRCFTQIAGDLAVMLEPGLWPLSRALESSTIDRKPALTDKIQNAFNSFYKTYGSVYGWQPIVYPAGPALLVNVPLTDLVSYQFVMNTITGAWCRFTNWNAKCMIVSEGDLYFALGRRVLQGWTGTSDNNTSIVALAKTAFTYANTIQRLKQVKLVRPVLTADTSITVQMALDTNFADSRLLSSATNFVQNLALWDAAIFDQSFWSGGSVTITGWRSVSHKPGKVFALRMRCSVKDIEVSWSATDFILESGGLMG